MAKFAIAIVVDYENEDAELFANDIRERITDLLHARMGDVTTNMRGWSCDGAQPFKTDTDIKKLRIKVVEQ